MSEFTTIRELKAENARLREALTPSAETKAAYMGEFQFNLPDLDEDGNEYTRHVNVPWTTIKEVMELIFNRALSTTGGDDV